MNNTKAISDLTFIGSGISTSFSILNFLKLINNDETNGKKITINIIEKYHEFNLGLPYGERSGFSTLLITSLRNFLIEPELGLFIAWLNSNKNWLLQELKNEGGALTEAWLTKNHEDIKHNRWEDLFIPRRFFGCYMDQLIKAKTDKLRDTNKIELNKINAKVIDVERINGIYNIKLENNENLKSKKVVLSVGSLPTNYLWQNKRIIEQDNLLFLNNPYKPKLKVSLNKIQNFISSNTNKTLNILIVGANASALEVIYKINDFKSEEFKNTNFTFLSTQGRIPDTTIDIEGQEKFKPIHLEALKNCNKLTAQTIAEAAFKDLDLADEINLGPASTVDIISKSFGVLLKSLNEKELEIFACEYGNAIGKRQRCAGQHYTDVIDNLEQQNRFEHLAGRFKDLAKDNNGDYLLTYLDTKTGKSLTTKKAFHIIINCVGGKNLKHDDLPILYKNLLQKKYCVPNQSNIGFHVNGALECSKNLHVMGPMLAGNVIENRAVWHVEHCGRIIWLSKVLSKILYNDIFPVQNINKKYDFVSKKLNSTEDIEEYKTLLKENWNNNVYYSYDHLKYFVSETDTLKCFQFKINGEVKIIMPIILRKIDTKHAQEECFDTITPYGYNGPLYDDKQVNSIDLQAFWKAIDSWYEKKNVVTEFIRFSLNRNYISYSGLLISTLLNVKGTLETDFELQWEKFLPKVRNNYRKAAASNLTFKILQEQEITQEEINTFYKIYTETMKRNNAKELYFFSLQYFTDLISNHNSEILLAFSCFNNLPISAELIIKNNDTLYAFLGGTEAEYFSHRPNDFLRVEIIKWAIKNKLKYYVLGGGLSDGDGLYKSKKAFFPKDGDIVFYTGRKINNYQIYENLCKSKHEDYNNAHKDEVKKYFFPFYRFMNR
ncbi:GNAT family N-acetyltransferase [Algibacter sp. AS12]|uniref:GNAT family N-acetyltransferase n=1 Tax=Algibacter sp. AS12 TaxID=3135773 RepID=UPI00398B87EA